MNNYKYFQFDSGRYFRYEINTYKFEILNDKYLWENSPNLVSIFFDAASNYKEVIDNDVLHKLQLFPHKKDYEEIVLSNSNQKNKF